MISNVRSRRSLLVYYIEAVFASCFLVYALTLSTITLYETCIAIAVVLALVLFPEFRNLPRITVLLTMIYIANTAHLDLVTDTGESIQGGVVVSLLTLAGLMLATIRGIC